MPSNQTKKATIPSFSVPPSLRQIRFFVAVFEESSFTAAAQREGATQSGVSQHVKQLEERLGAVLFTRSGRAVAPTLAGQRYYEECVAVLKRLEAAGYEIRDTHKEAAQLRVGLMPTFTRAVLAPALQRFMATAPGATVYITEAYSGVLTDLVRHGELDFAIVPAFEGGVGLSTTLLLRDREMLVSANGRTGAHLKPVRLSELGPLEIVLPGPQNTRRRTIETYFATNGVEIKRRLELDAMMGTMEFVATSQWVAILPAVMLVGDLASARFEIRPITGPTLFSDFVLIEPSRRALSPAARTFAELLKAESERTVFLRQQSMGADEAETSAATSPAPRRRKK